MSDIKISQLTNVTELGNEDLIPISKNVGGGNWQSVSISSEALLKNISTSTNVIKVAKEGIRDADTIEDAINIAISLSPSESAPVTINVFPDNYEENNPLIIPEWVSILSVGDYYSTFIKANNAGDIIVTNGNTVLRGFQLVGNSSYSNTAYHANPSTKTSSIFRCYVDNCIIGLWCEGSIVSADSIIGVSQISHPSQKFVYATDGGKINCYFCSISNKEAGPNVGTGYHSEDSGTEIYLYSCEAKDVQDGIFIQDDGYIDCFSSHFEDCVDSLHIGSSGTQNSIKFMACIIEGSITNDLHVESPTAYVAYIGHLDSSKFSIVDGATINIVADDENGHGGLVTGKASLQGKVSIGTPGAIYLQEDIQLNIGEGSAFVNDKQGNEIVEYWSYEDNVPSGSKFTRYSNNAGVQLTGANDALVIGCKYPFPAIRLDIISPMVTSNYITTEYWNGSSWIDLSVGYPGGGVAGYRRSDFLKRNNQIFSNIETQFVEFNEDLFDDGDWEDDYNILDEIPAWDSGDSCFAIRFRNNGPLTTGMTFANGLVKPHTFMVSTSGLKANFGLYRTPKKVYMDSTSLNADPTNPPQYVSLSISSNIGYTNQPSFTKANSVSRVSTAFVIPFDIDTSSRLSLSFDGIVTDSSVGDVLTNMYIARIDINNPPSTLPITEELIGEQLTTTVGSANSFFSVIQDVDISGYNYGDILLISFARNAADPFDTYTGDFVIGDLMINYYSKFV